MRLAVVGAGPIGLGTAMFVQTCGHAATLWSPSGSVTRDQHSRMQAIGALEGDFTLTIVSDIAAALDRADAIMFAVPANAHRSLIDAVVPYISAGQVVVLWTQSSLSSLYLSKRLAQRGVDVPIAIWSAPLIGGRRTSDRQVRINTVRPSIELAAVPERSGNRVLESCSALFGARFSRRRALDAALGGVNSVMHLPQALCNLTRIEQAESWSTMGNTSVSVARLIDALDQERLQVAAAFGSEVLTLPQFLQRSFTGLPLAALGEQASLLAQRLKAGSEGPRTLQTRFIDEDVPYGAVPIEALGHVARVPTPAHRACIDLFELLLQRELRQENRMLAEIELARRTKSELLGLFSQGWHE